MNPTSSNTAHSLYVLYETLPNKVQRAFLQKLVQNNHQELAELSFYLGCKAAKEENEFLSEEEQQAFLENFSS